MTKVDEIETIARKIAQDIADDVESGQVPADVADWQSLHDYVDANQYTLSYLDWTGTDDNGALHYEVEGRAFEIFAATRVA